MSDVFADPTAAPAATTAAAPNIMGLAPILQSNPMLTALLHAALLQPSSLYGNPGVQFPTVPAPVVQPVPVVIQEPVDEYETCSEPLVSGTTQMLSPNEALDLLKNARKYAKVMDLVNPKGGNVKI